MRAERRTGELRVGVILAHAVAATCIAGASVVELPLAASGRPSSPRTGWSRAARQEASISPAEIRAAIAELGDFDYDTRMNAARRVRRAPPALAVPALVQTAAEHADGYVRYRALVLLTGFNDPRGEDAVVGELDDPNDRLREVAYAFLEDHPRPGLAPHLLAALEREQSEFVRPALVRALAALGDDPAVRETLVAEAFRGEDFFRSAVIEALGDYGATYAVPALIEIAGLEGPLQDDAALALGKIGDDRALSALAALQRSAPQATQPTIAAAICLVGRNCPTHQRFLAQSLRFATDTIGFQPLLRGAAGGLGALGAAGHVDAVDVLIDVGGATRDPARAPIALAIGTVALRSVETLLEALSRRASLDTALALLGEAFDMLEEDYEEERFYATVRRTYWQAAEATARRRVAETLIQRLEF